MTLAEAIETTRIHRIAGLTGDRMAWVTTRPFRPPRHTISAVGLIGGGHVPMPGEVARAQVIFQRHPYLQTILGHLSEKALQQAAPVYTTGILLSPKKHIKRVSRASATATSVLPAAAARRTASRYRYRVLLSVILSPPGR
jgi:hypothetical protein